MCVFIASKGSLCLLFYVGMYTLCIRVNGRWWGNLLYARALPEVANANGGILIGAWG